MDIEIGRLMDVYMSKGYTFFTKGAYNLNIFGVRSANRDQSRDAFDDVIGVAYKDGYMRWQVDTFEATTDPGVTHMTAPMFAAAIKGGTAILAPGQYLGAYQLGYHGGGAYRHKALRQIGKVRIYRDADRDNILDLEPESIEDGWFGINIHAASLWRDIEQIGRYSAGCQVIRKPDDFKAFMNLCAAQKRKNGWDTFTYTLFDAKDFDL